MELSARTCQIHHDGVGFVGGEEAKNRNAASNVPPKLLSHARINAVKLFSISINFAFFFFLSTFVFLCMEKA